MKVYSSMAGRSVVDSAAESVVGAGSAVVAELLELGILFADWGVFGSAELDSVVL